MVPANLLGRPGGGMVLYLHSPLYQRIGEVPSLSALCAVRIVRREAEAVWDEDSLQRAPLATWLHQLRCALVEKHGLQRGALVADVCASTAVAMYDRGVTRPCLNHWRGMLQHTRSGAPCWYECECCDSFKCRAKFKCGACCWIPLVIKVLEEDGGPTVERPVE